VFVRLVISAVLVVTINGSIMAVVVLSLLPLLDPDEVEVVDVVIVVDEVVDSRVKFVIVGILVDDEVRLFRSY
jgi:hypothetical protein